MVDNSTLRKSLRKAKPKSLTEQLKPYAGFPLSAHAAGSWQKKILGRVHYFGRWGRVVNGKLERLPEDGWRAALALYEKQRDALHSGRAPSDAGDQLTLRVLCNRFLAAKHDKQKAGGISGRSFGDYRDTTDLLIEKFGRERIIADLGPSDFENLLRHIRKSWGVHRQGNVIGRVRSVFKYALDNELVGKPVRFGSEFKKPESKQVKKHRRTQPKRLFEAAQIRAMIDAAPAPLAAMIYLGVNAGLGNTDCGELERRHIDFKHGVLDYPRPKTEEERRAILWPETIAAALLTPQGKWLADFFILADGERLLLDCERAQMPMLVQRLSRFRLRSKVTLARGRGAPRLCRLGRRAGHGGRDRRARSAAARRRLAPAVRHAAARQRASRRTGTAIAWRSACPTARATWRPRRPCCWRPGSTS